MSVCIKLKTLEKSAFDHLRGIDVPEIIHVHLESCEFCNEQYQELLTQYSLADKQFESIPEPMVEKLSQMLVAPSNRFVLVAQALEPIVSTHAKDLRILTRAADSTVTAKKHRYENRGVLSTENGELLIRMMQTSDTRITQLHLIAEDEEKYRNVPVLIEPLGLELFSDELGRVTLDDVELPNLQDLRVTVHTPRAVFDLEEMGQEWKEFIGKGEVRFKNADDDHIYVEFNPEGQNYCLTIRLEKSQMSDGSQKIQVSATKEGRSFQLKSVNKGVAVFHEISESPVLRVKVFG